MAADESDYANGIWSPSPNFGFTAVGQNGRSDGTTTYAIKAIVMHGTSGLMPGCLEWLQNPISKASATYLVSRDGLVHQLVREDCVAWTSGDVEAPSIYLNGPDPNLWSIGIEHEMPNGNTGTLTPAQQAASIALITDIRRRRGPLPLIPHHAIAPQSRAHCPGDAFPLALIDTEAQPAMSVTPTRPWAAIDLQRDKRWAGHELGTGQGVSIGDYGCLLTCHAMTAGYYGHSVTPLNLGLLYVQHGVFVSNGQGQADLLDDDALARLYGDVSVQAIHDYTGVPADLSVLAAVSADPTLTAVIEVDFDADPSNGVAPHFVVLDHYDGQHVYVLDPWYGDGEHADDIRIHFGDPAVTIQKIVVYRGTPAPQGPAIGMGRPGRVQVLVDMTLRRTPTLDKSPANVFFLPSGQPQLCYHGAVLQTTGRFTPHFREVTAGTHVGWLYVGDDPNHWTNLRSI